MTTAARALPVLEARDLTRTFGTGDHVVHAVRSASFAVQPGEILAVVGESGSGKTTVARMLLRLLEPSAGDIRLDGQDVRTLSGGRTAYWRAVQAVFQDPFASFNQFYRVGRVMHKAADMLSPRPSADERAARIEQALRNVGLEPGDVLSKWPHELSGGQRQRVMMARGLLLQPRLLIADEPTSMLDASLRATALNLLLDLRQTYGLTIVFITHDIGQAAYVSDRVLVMSRGEIVEQGPTDEILFNPTHPYTQRLMADVPKLPV